MSASFERRSAARGAGPHLPLDYFTDVFLTEAD